MRIAIVGAGWSGAVIAQELAQAGHSIDVFERRAHVGGNAHTERDPETGVMVHKFGPHIFHTNNKRTWDYVRQFGEFVPYIQRTKAIVGSQMYQLPINLLTINQFFGRTFGPAQAEEFMRLEGESSITNPKSFEEQALRFVGREMYEAFFKGYTTKQWGLSPRDIPATILKRLPIRFTYDDNYFDHQFQGIPRDGYTAVIARLLNNPNIHVHLNALFFRTLVTHYGHVFYSGPLDEWYSHKLGRLPYRTLDFKVRRGIGDAQGAPIINYCDEEVPYTRITEHKHFAPWEAHEKTITFEEHSRASEPYDEPFYPIHLVSEQDMLIKYTELARQETNVTFVGRLGTYRYIDMDVAVSEALTVSGKFNT